MNKIITEKNLETNVLFHNGHFYLHMPNMCMPNSNAKDGQHIYIVSIRYKVVSP